MAVHVAKSAGFCFGVKQAVEMVEQQLQGGVKIATLGPIIHNPIMVDRLAQQGVLVIDDVAQTPAGYTVVIRSHGVAPSVYRQLEEKNIPYIDATCPFVKKIHRLVEEHSGQDSLVLLAGDPAHPEIRGIVGYCKGDCLVFQSEQELREKLHSFPDRGAKTVILAAQTTFSVKEWTKCVEFAKNGCTNLRIFDTICIATMLRQKEAEELAKASDIMIVVGGQNSSNSTKLADICRAVCKTVFVQNADQLSLEDFARIRIVGITAGASTPAFIIKEVQKVMSDVINTNQTDELSFEEMLEQSFKTIYSKEKVTAVVTNVSPNEIAVDIGTKHAGYVPFNEFTEDPNAKLEDLVKVGDEIELMVMRVNDVEGTAMLSKKRLDAIAGFEKIVEAEESGAVLDGVVVDVVKGGVFAVTNGVRVFIPASQATASRNQQLETLLKQPVQFTILEVNRQRRRAVGSIRAVLKEQRKVLEDKFWEEVEVGKHYKGTVKSLTSYGAFVDLGGVDGMAHISDLSWSRIKHPSEVVSVGDLLEVYVRDIDRENKKVSLGYKKTEDNPWEVLKRDHQVGDSIKVKVVSLTSFGAFAQLIPGVDGLIHISQIANERINKPSDVLSVGQEVDVKITDIDFDKKRISLSIRALLATEPEATADNEAPAVYEAAPPEAAE
ncbi:bifunctional 4-hydroxy-3-methylbut-2-enyl diphosphate reductase/30S ribosomal protein S1 [Oscillospiraceae bacterium MB08-C2-2]|nr:bifunctional 4-hydroxy-3-methylbut-2-enyl diphosphate reductase/30S ribosomal protein S1 [Oscillospiraceae bacterium MB08-C2-2]